MKTAGIIGGLTWQSTLDYYRLLNEGVNERMGRVHSCPCIIHSVDFEPIAEAMKAGRWETVAEILARAARSLEHAGADFFVMASNTVHKVANQLQSAVEIPFVSILESVAKHIQNQGLKKALLLSTRFTAEEKIYEPAARIFGIELLYPDRKAIESINRIIFDELTFGRVLPESVKKAVSICAEAKQRGGDCVILGCTELPMLLNDDNSPLPVIDSTKVHVEAILNEII